MAAPKRFFPTGSDHVKAAAVLDRFCGRSEADNAYSFDAITQMIVKMSERLDELTIAKSELEQIKKDNEAALAARTRGDLEEESQRSQEMTQSRDSAMRQGSEAVKLLLQNFLGSTPLDVTAIPKVMRMAISDAAKDDFTISMHYEKPIKFADSYSDVQLPPLRNNHFQLTWLALGGSLGPGDQLFDRLVQLQWLEQVIMPELHSGGIYGLQSMELIPILSHWIVHVGIKDNVGLARVLAVCLLYDVVNHFPFKDASRWYGVVKGALGPNFWNMDLLSQAANIRLLKAIDDQELVEGPVGPVIAAMIKDMDPRLAIPEILRGLRQIASASTSVPCAFADLMIDGREVVLLYSELIGEVVFVKADDGSWHCSTTAAIIDYNYEAGGIATAKYPFSDVVVQWKYQDKYAIDLYMEAHREYRGTLKSKSLSRLAGDLMAEAMELDV